MQTSKRSLHWGSEKTARDPAEGQRKLSFLNFYFLFKHYRICQEYKLTVKWSFLCSAFFVDRLSHQGQAFHGNIKGDNEQKSIWEAEVVIWLKKSVHVQEARGVRDRLTLSVLCRLLCVRVCVFASALPPFFIWLASTLSLLGFFSPSPLDSCVFFHVLFSFIVCKSRSCTADFCLFQTLFATRQLFLLCLMAHYWNDDFQLGPVQWNCVPSCDLNHVWAMYEPV